MKRTYRLDIAFLKTIDLELVRVVARLVERAQRLVESRVLWIIFSFEALHSRLQVYRLGLPVLIINISRRNNNSTYFSPLASTV